MTARCRGLAGVAPHGVPEEASRRAAHVEWEAARLTPPMESHRHVAMAPFINGMGCVNGAGGRLVQAAALNRPETQPHAGLGAGPLHRSWKGVKSPEMRAQKLAAKR